MLFNSYIFVLCFLPVVVIGYFILGKMTKGIAPHLYLLLMSLWFYAYFNIKYLPLILISVVVNFCVFKIMQKVSEEKKRKVLLILGLIFDVGLLFYYKYCNFFVENINSIFKTNFIMEKLILPLGISFFTIQQISFLLDSYRKEAADYHFVEYAIFVTFFPQLIAGPIVTHDELIPQFRDESKRKLNWDNLAQGFYCFTLGMTKKVILADTLGNAVNAGFAISSELHTFDILVVMLAYTFQIYFDFSGYSDMAIGIGKMLNIDLPVNFNSPYKSLTIVEFWERWHMTLTRFLTKYIYIPLGGNRKGKIRTYVNILLVFLISGIWHGAGWTFVIWGVMHGLFQVITKIFKKSFDEMHSVLSWMITFAFLNVSWLVFRANSIKEVLVMMKNFLRLELVPLHASIVENFELVEFHYFFDEIVDFDIWEKCENIYVFAFIVISLIIVLGSANTIEKMKKFKGSIRSSIVTIILFIWCILSFEGVSTFLYFNF